MNILITSAASALAQDLARAFSTDHSVHLTDVVDVALPWPFTRCALGHDAATADLVAGVDALIHLAEPPPDYASETEESANRLLDFHTRCTYNLLLAASEAGVARCVYTSSLSLFANIFDEVGCGEDWAVDERWRPRPSTEPPVLARHLGEFVCREFAREGRIAVTCLRLGNVGQPGGRAAPPDDPTWLAHTDAVHAFERALAAPAEPWAIYHVQSAFPGARFSSARARDALGFAPDRSSGGEA